MKSDKLVDAMGGVREDYLEALTEGREALTVQEGGRGLSRRSFVRIGMAAAAVGVGAFLGLSIFGDEETLPVFDGGSDGSDGSTKKLGFVLTAYAEGLPQDDGSVRPLSTFTGDWGQGPDVDEGTYFANYVLMLDCSLERPGNGWVSIELEGPHVTDSVMEEGDKLGSEPLIFLKDTVHSGYRKSTGTVFGTSAEHTNIEWPMEVRVHFPMSDVLRAAIDSGDYKTQLLEARRSFNEILATTTVHTSVEYNDGETIEQRYAIAPIDDFDAMFTDYVDSVLAAVANVNENSVNGITFEVADGRRIRQEEMDYENGLYIYIEHFILQDYFNTIDEQYSLYTIREIEG